MSAEGRTRRRYLKSGKSRRSSELPKSCDTANSRAAGRARSHFEDLNAPAGDPAPLPGTASPLVLPIPAGLSGSSVLIRAP